MKKLIIVIIVPFISLSILAQPVQKIDDLTDGKSDDDGSSLFLGVDSGLNDNGTRNVNVGVGFNALYTNSTGHFNGVPPTNKEMDLPFVIRYVIEGDKIVDHWLIADQMILMQQLGIVEAPAE